jgi:cytidine deaminase
MIPHEEILALLKPRAAAAAANAYAPYSCFPVGAAVLTAGGRIYVGCNVENAAFGLAQCAERSALAAAVAGGATRGAVSALVIYTPGLQAHPPCGACRQVMHELMSADSMVLSCCDGEKTRRWLHSEYLPDPFVPEALPKPRNERS